MKLHNFAALPCGCRAEAGAPWFNSTYVPGTPMNPRRCACVSWEHWTTIDGQPRFRRLDDAVVSGARVVAAACDDRPDQRP